MTTIPVLRGTSRADLLAIPSFLFGFHPTESVVLIGLRGNVVNFSARLDADWFATHFDQVADQVLNAAANLGRCDFVLLGYSRDLELASISVTEAADVLGRGRVVEALITDGAQYWSLIDGEGPLPFDIDSSPITAHAVYEGVNIAGSREEAVAPVTQWDPPGPGAVDITLGQIEAMTSTAALSLLEELVEAAPPLDDHTDALTLGCLLLDEDRTAAVLTRLRTENADQLWHNLAAARRVAPQAALPSVVALLGVASWLSGRGAQATACIEQMAQLDRNHPVGAMLARVHHHAIPPRTWDE